MPGFTVRVVFRCAGSLLLAGVLLGQASEGPPVAGPATAASTSAQAELLRRLESTDPAEREAAKKELAAIASFWRQPEMLKRMSAATSDPQLQALFDKRIKELGEISPSKKEIDPEHLSTISVDFKDTDILQIVASINSQLGGDYLKASTASLGARLTVQASDKPLMNVLAEMQNQYSFELTASGSPSLVASSGMPPQRIPVGMIRSGKFQASGPALLCVLAVDYRRVIDYQAKHPESQRSFALTLGILLDPRLTVQGFEPIHLVRASDSLNHNLMPEGKPPRALPAKPMLNFYVEKLELRAPETLGDNLSLACDDAVTVSLSSTSVSLNDIQDESNRTITWGKRTIRVASFTHTNSGGTINSGVINLVSTSDGTLPAVTYTLTDQNGKRVWKSGVCDGNVHETFQIDRTSSRFKLTVETVERTRSIPLHFELQDVSLK